MSTQSMEERSQNIFYKAVTAAFDNWTAFQLAVTHSFGGRDTKEKADWFLNSTYEWLVDTGDIQDHELQEFLQDTMFDDFNTQLDDNSAIILARLIISFYNMYKNGQYTELSAILLQKYPNKASVVNSMKVKTNQTGEESSSSDDESGDDENNNEANCENMNTEESEKPKVDKIEAIRESEEFQAMDEGWTYVASAGKKLTK